MNRCIAQRRAAVVELLFHKQLLRFIDAEFLRNLDVGIYIFFCTAGARIAVKR